LHAQYLNRLVRYTKRTAAAFVMYNCHDSGEHSMLHLYTDLQKRTFSREQ